MIKHLILLTLMAIGAGCATSRNVGDWPLRGAFKSEVEANIEHFSATFPGRYEGNEDNWAKVFDGTLVHVWRDRGLKVILADDWTERMRVPLKMVGDSVYECAEKGLRFVIMSDDRYYLEIDTPTGTMREYFQRY